jgi:murein DD-endopeptidase MepM/ murein hydrolase activator NlpD
LPSHSGFYIASAVAGKVYKVVNGHTTGYCSQPGDPILEGNYVIIASGTQYTIYYHLAYGSILVAKDDLISAGQRIATAGNTGSSCGIHLHYMLTTVPDPNNQAAAMNPEGHWTTTTGPAATGGAGRVPWLATYSTESNSGTEVMSQGSTRAHWVKFKNTGAGRGRLSTTRTVTGERFSTRPTVLAPPVRRVSFRALVGKPQPS